MAVAEHEAHVALLHLPVPSTYAPRVLIVHAHKRTIGVA